VIVAKSDHVIGKCIRDERRCMGHAEYALFNAAIVLDVCAVLIAPKKV
jgi:hypothetical protein